MNCETCGTTHNGSYGSGRFCSKSCANTRLRSEEVRAKISSALRQAPKPHKHCVECNAMFVPLRHTTTFCSRKCARTNSIRKAKQAQMSRPPKWSDIHREAYRTGKNYVGGGTTKWIEYKDIKVQGSYEVRMCRILDEMVSRGEIRSWEYARDTFEYQDATGQDRTYTVDFTIFGNDNDCYFIETKGYQKANDVLKWKAVRDSGHRLDVLFLADLILLEDKYELR